MGWSPPQPRLSVRVRPQRERVIDGKLPERIAARRASGCEWLPILLGIVILVGCPLAIWFGGLARWAPTPEDTARARTLTAVATHTIEPINLVAPTLPPPTPTPSPVIGKVTERCVNVRAAPNTQAKIVAWLHQDDVVTLIGQNETGAWYRVKMLALTEPSWVFAELVEIVSGNPRTLPITPPAQ